MQHRSHEAWVLLIAGLAWLAAGLSSGVVALVLSLVPGVLLVATGAGELLWSEDRRLLQFGAAGGAIGVVLAIPAMFSLGFATALLLGLLSAAAFVASGLVSLRTVPATPGVPAPRGGAAMGAKVAADEALLSTMSVTRKLPRGDRVGRIREEVDEALELFASRGWLEKPTTYHRRPLPLDAPCIRPAKFRGIAYEHLSFDSEYEPYAE
jgi:hypothetical protein